MVVYVHSLYVRTRKVLGSVGAAHFTQDRLRKEAVERAVKCDEDLVRVRERWYRLNGKSVSFLSVCSGFESC